ncbi:hypothetical protein [Natrarchaeobaculum sulfurireducens]|uniref:Putative membrane protein n=1 Tax=Natrarchaeobaculum sulfurireducens TaxID=2044521 RepID=A0A346PR14_9EURY|nr:hypothetical protein [Natrarchaeobaculum sulfurireducens]AXR81959.1 putative membrane protein [Natrarchaeobaculum sulfurireducens]
MVLHFRKATSVYKKTWPYVLLQFGIGVLFALLGVAYFGLALWLVYRFLWAGGGVSLLVVAVAMLAVLAVFAFVWRLIQRYVLYMVKAGHIAVIATAVETDTVPENQIRYGVEQVGENFFSASGLWVVDEVIDAVLRQLSRSVARFQQLLPVPVPRNIQVLFTLLERSVTMAVSYLDNAILAYIFVDDTENTWRSARDGVVLYGKTWKLVLGSTIAIVFGMYALAFVLAMVLAPLAVALDFLPTTIEALSWLLVGGMVAVVHTGIVKPWVKTVVITTFLVEQRDHTPDSETMAWIEERSDRFAELVEKAENEEPIEEDHQESGGAPDPAAKIGD